MFFGPIGTAFSSANVALERVTGKDMGSHIIAMLNNEETNTTKTQIAQTNPMQLPTSPAVKKNTINTVSAWAATEMYHQNSIALKQGIDLPKRAYSTLVENITTTSLQTAHNFFQPVKPNLQQLTLNQRQESKTPNEVSALAFKVTNHSLPETASKLNPIKPNKYSSVSKSIKTPPPFSNKAPPLSSNPSNGGWFKTSMSNALSKYHQAKSSQFFHDNSNIPFFSSLH